MMKYKVASIDIETLGLDSDNCSIIEFGCVLDDFVTPLDQLPKYRRFLHPRDWVFHGEPYAMALNAAILKELANFQSKSVPYSPPVDSLDSWTIPDFSLDSHFKHWLAQVSDSSEKLEPITIVGKNFANFDLLFLKKIGFGDCAKYHRRILDVGSLFFDPKIDQNVPGLDECLKRAGIDKQVEHNTIDDALDVLKCLRFKHGIK